MAKQIEFEVCSGNKTYASAKNAADAFEKKFGNTDARYFVHQLPSGRWIPVAIGMQALQLGVHFLFHCVA